MFNRRTLAVIKRELRENLFAKSFIIATLLIPLFMFGILGLQAFLMAVGGDEKAEIKIAAHSDEIIEKLKLELSSVDHVKTGFYQIEYLKLSQDEFQDYLKTEKQELMDGKITGIIYIPQGALKDKKLEYYSKNPNNNSLFEKLKHPVNKALVGLYFTEKQFSPDDIQFASQGVNFNGFRISKEDKIKEEGYGNLILSFLFTFLLYFSMLMMGTIMMRSVVHEKTTRIVEVLLSSLNPRELVTGKILGITTMATVQMAIWLSPLVVLVSTTLFILPPEFLISIKLGHVLYFLVNYFVGLITFLALYAAAGAIFDNDQDAQSAVWPLMLLIMIPFFIAITMQNNPDSTIVKVSSMLPFASLMVMPARLILIDVPTWQFILSIIVNIITLVLMFMLAGKIYRVGILMTGKKPKWGEVVRWLKYKY